MKDRHLVEIETTHLAICYHELGALKEEKNSAHLENNWVNNRVQQAIGIT